MLCGPSSEGSIKQFKEVLRLCAKKDQSRHHAPNGYLHALFSPLRVYRLDLRVTPRGVLPRTSALCHALLRCDHRHIQTGAKQAEMDVPVRSEGSTPMP